MDSKSLIIGLLVGVVLCLAVIVVNDTTKTANAQVISRPRYQMCSLREGPAWYAFVIDQHTGQVYGLGTEARAAKWAAFQKKGSAYGRMAWTPLIGAPN